MSTPRRLGVLVPCRNEAPVIERKLRDLARQGWPASTRRHVVLVVDDHSEDGTAVRAEGLRHELDQAGLDLRVESSEARPGKNGALEHGLARLADEVDLVVLTDADVLLGEGALERLAAAFDRHARLGMATGEQVFVDQLDELGRARPRAAIWDRGTAWVRRLESSLGRLFSVHGQLLAWRAELGLRPRRGVAADDVDLMLQVRGSAWPEVRLVRGARFFEQKVQAEEGDAQALRRARAWFQVFEGLPRPAGFGGLASLQWVAYRHLPAHMTWIVCELLGLLVALAFLAWGPAAALVTLLALVALSLSPLGAEVRRTLAVARQARRLERDGAMEEAWETRRA